MSSVTSIILITGVGDSHAANTLGTYLQSMNRCTLNQVDSHSGGDKHMEADVYLSAVNGLDVDTFLDVFYSIRWLSPEAVQLMIKEEHDEAFTLYSFEDK